MKRRIATLAAAVLLTAGCSSLPTMQEVPLPGGADVGDHPYKVVAEFENVLSLVPQSAVKVNDVPVGRVIRIELPTDGWTAKVELIVNGDVKLPANAFARLDQSSLLGEKFIQLSAPPQGGTGSLTDGAVIPLDRTNRNAEVEEVFGAMSLLLNGGGISQMQTITRELNKAFGGENGQQFKVLIKRVTTMLSSLNGNKKAIVDAIDGLNRLSANLASRKQEISESIDDLGPGLKVLDEQRAAMVRMLRSLERLSGIASTTIRKSKADMVADLKALEPTLRRLAQSGADLPNALEALFTFPFTDAVGPAIKGDYLNVYLSITAVPGSTEVIPPIAPLSLPNTGGQ
ncbi:MCE family protein [Actinocorallia lasiicapitis]